MGVRFEFAAYGDKLVSRELTNMGARGLDASPAFRDIADLFRRAEKRRFQTRGNGTWRPLAPATIKAKGHGKVLIDTGNLRASLTRRSDPHQVLTVTPQFMVFGTRLEYAAYHQRGRGVPVRKPLGFTEPTKRSSLRLLQRYIVTGHTS